MYKVSANGVKGMIRPMMMINEVITITGTLAQLCTNGIFFVRIICTINVCETSPNTNQPEWNRLCDSGELALNTKKHHREKHIVKNRADRSNIDRETADAFRLPFFGGLQIFFVHFIPWDRGLRNVVQQILDKDLYRKHGQKRKQRTRSDDAEYISKITADRHFDVFDDVPESFPTIKNSFVQDHQIFFKEDDIRAFFRDIDCIVDGDSHICFFQGGGIIDSIPQYTDGVTFFP